MAEKSALTTGHDGRHPTPLLREPRMTDGIDADMNAVQVPQPHTPPDC